LKYGEVVKRLFKWKILTAEVLLLIPMISCEKEIHPPAVGKPVI